MHHILSARQFTRIDIERVLNEASDIEKHLKKGGQFETLHGKILATLFYEPSTRTRLSFEAAMLKLGGQVISAADMSVSSSAKGETLEDTARIVSAYADAIVVRHHEAHSAERMSSTSLVPIINAGDGPNEHPTQALLDLYTIWKRKGTIDGLKICFVGDMKHGRTVHSLVQMLQHFNVELTFVSPIGLSFPTELLDTLKTPHNVTENFSDMIGDADIIYMTRIQKERFKDPKEYERFKDLYILDSNTLTACKKDVAILHPLPRINEILPEIDGLPQAAYFEQAANGLPVRMALLKMIFTK